MPGLFDLARRFLFQRNQPNGCAPLEASEMKAKRRRTSGHDPDDIYRGAEIELPWVVSHIGGEPTPWDEEFSF